ncbi:hypothetical protein G6L37_01390 [Agrobacterium rubi]|nr:hypothetical protein [Agrobacterium rubi]NTF24046.1 hypothetical protein [Agrobacterium rubi]
MRILGGHDYYDTALAFGRDETLVFVRSASEKAVCIKPSETVLLLPQEKTLTFQTEHSLRRNQVTHDRVDYTAFPRILWFAGRRHGAIQVFRRGHEPGRYVMDDLWFWDEARFAEFIESIGTKLRDPRKGKDPQTSINSASIRDFFDNPGKDFERDWLVENGISIALLQIERYQEYAWRIDSDGLKDIFFQRRLNPYEAFQSLSQWIGGVLPRKGADMVNIRDEKTMLSKHGMDKWSFRKPPETA